MLQLQQNGVLDINLDDKKQVSVDLKYAHIGKDVSLLTFPGEALSRLGLPIKHEMDGKYKLFVGLANASYGYFIPSDEFGKIPGRNTEEMFSMDKYAADEIKQAIDLKLKKSNEPSSWGMVIVKRGSLITPLLIIIIGNILMILSNHKYCQYA